MQILKPTIQKPNLKRIYGFDIETYDNNKKFYCASLYGDDFKQTFFNLETLLTFLKSGYLKDCYIVATNLSFDFFGIIFNRKEIKNFTIIMRGSDLLMSKTYIFNKSFNRKNTIKEPCSITFLDTGNYAKFSVENWGKILNLPKLNKPKALGILPKSEKEKEEMINYNMRDSEISQKALNFLWKGFEELGGTPRLTVASSAMSLFRNKYLDKVYFGHNKETLLEIFDGYYGGRTEAFYRGKIINKDYYDINSLYPSRMVKSFPDPNSLRSIFSSSDKYINNYEGISKVRIVAPKLFYPYLPLRHEGKLIFPYGEFSGWYSHFELRKALKYGYVIKKVIKTHYYTRLCSPFKLYVNDLYKLRRKYKKDKSRMEIIVKLMLNSLYGKFAQKFMDVDNLIPFTDDMTADKLASYKYPPEIIGEFLRIKEERRIPDFCIPIWSTYVTAYARDCIYNYLTKYKALYCDTDSIITDKSMKSSNILGKMKLEKIISKGVIVKPKFYSIVGENFEDIKIKGLPQKAIKKINDQKVNISTKMTYNQFIDLLINPNVEYNKFVKLKEAMRRGFIPNEIINIRKEFSLEDTKREWKHLFNPKELQKSNPLKVII